MYILKKDGVPTYKVKIQQQGRENLWRAKETRSEPDYKRQLHRMVLDALHLLTSPELRLMIKLQPILKPVQESVHKKQLPILRDLKNATNETLKLATKPLQPSTYPTNKDELDGATSQRVAMREADVGRDDLLKYKIKSCT